MSEKNLDLRLVDLIGKVVEGIRLTTTESEAAASDSVVVRRIPSTTLPIRSTNRRSRFFSDTLVLLSSDTINRV